MEKEQSFTPGEMVEILNGPFTKFTGKVKEINNDKRMLAVEVKDESGILLGKVTIEFRGAMATNCGECNERGTIIQTWRDSGAY